MDNNRTRNLLFKMWWWGGRDSPLHDSHKGDLYTLGEILLVSLTMGLMFPYAYLRLIHSFNLPSCSPFIAVILGVFFLVLFPCSFPVLSLLLHLFPLNNTGAKGRKYLSTCLGRNSTTFD